MPGAVFFFVGFDGVEVVLVGGWLREDCVELFPSCLYVGYVCEGFPDEVGEVGGDLEMGYFLEAFVVNGLPMVERKSNRSGNNEVFSGNKWQ